MTDLQIEYIFKLPFQVIQVDDEAKETEVKFLKKSGSHYSFPALEDIAWVPFSDSALVEPPNINNRGLYIFN